MSSTLMFPRDSRTSKMAIAFLFCVSGHCGKRMSWHQTVIIPLLCCLKCGQPAFLRFAAHVPRAAVFYFWMGCLCFCWWRWLIFTTPSDMPPLLQFTPVFFSISLPNSTSIFSFLLSHWKHLLWNRWDFANPEQLRPSNPWVGASSPTHGWELL